MGLKPQMVLKQVEKYMHTWIDSEELNDENFGCRWADSHLLGFISESLVVLEISLTAENQPFEFDFLKLYVSLWTSEYRFDF